jgi:protein-tyrosine phosphatase
MRQIPPHALWLGHAGDGRDFRAILDARIQAVVQLAAEEEPLGLPRELMYCRFPLLDGAGNDEKLLHLAVTSVANLLESRIPTLVCCGGGMSRSPAIVAAALAVVFQEKLEQCLERIAAHHPSDVVPALWNDVKALVESRFLA